MASSTRSSRSGETWLTINGARDGLEADAGQGGDLTHGRCSWSDRVPHAWRIGTPGTQAAAERIAELVAVALDRSEAPIERAASDSVRLAACKDILDRVGYKPRERTDMTVAGRLAVYLPQRQALE